MRATKSHRQELEHRMKGRVRRWKVVLKELRQKKALLFSVVNKMRSMAECVMAVESLVSGRLLRRGPDTNFGGVPGMFRNCPSGAALRVSMTGSRVPSGRVTHSAVWPIGRLNSSSEISSFPIRTFYSP